MGKGFLEASAAVVASGPCVVSGGADVTALEPVQDASGAVGDVCEANLPRRERRRQTRANSKSGRLFVRAA